MEFVDNCIYLILWKCLFHIEWIELTCRGDTAETINWIIEVFLNPSLHWFSEDYLLPVVVAVIAAAAIIIVASGVTIYVLKYKRKGSENKFGRYDFLHLDEYKTIKLFILDMSCVKYLWSDPLKFHC